MKKTYVSPELEKVSLQLGRLLNDDIAISDPQIPTEGHADGDDY